LVEYIVRKAPYRSKVEKLFKEAATGKLKLYVSYVTLSETLYVASRIYQVAKVSDPNNEALNYIMWLKRQVEVIGIDENIALRAGELKKLLHIALPDCYVIATAETLHATPLFKKIEKEMKPVQDTLRKLGVKFLEETP
ncbi:MAG: PIN domain nuclease, partial [Thermoprotei archaeon]